VKCNGSREPVPGILFCDFEFKADSGERPVVHCMVAHELRSGRVLKMWGDELGDRPPFSVSPESLFVAYYASAELGCFLALGWPMPQRILDLFVEFRCHTNGLPLPSGSGLLGALVYFGLDSMAATEKSGMRELAIRGGPYTPREKSALLDYCESDVDSLAKLLPAMLPRIDLPRALLRGRYMAAAARIEWTGVPIDVETLQALRRNWSAIQSRLIQKVDADYGVFVPTGSRLNPKSTYGRAVLETAEEWGIDPHQLADAVNYVWEEERDAGRERQEAIQAVRRATGLTTNRIAKWEESGRDVATYPGLDVAARELAGEYPELGIGTGYDADAGYDGTDYSSLLWEILREETPKAKQRSDPATMDRVAEMIAQSGDVQSAEPMSFNAQRWAEFLIENGIPWPRLESGVLNLSDDAFRQMARVYPVVAPIRELRHTLSQLRLNDLAVGSDGRNRCLLSAFQSRTGRNQPSNSKFIFGPSCWLRSLIKPAPGRAVAYVDWSQQEFGIAAALSADPAMLDAYRSGDPYLAFAKQAGAAPADATKQSHPQQRELFKVCSLAVLYGMGAKSLAVKLGKSPVHGRELLQAHKAAYPTFWKWSEATVDQAMLHGRLWTVFGWWIHVGGEVNPRSLANFPVQANGAEMLRMACCLATERGVNVCAPIHDALLVEASADAIGDVVAETQAAMAEASRNVLDGFELQTDAEIVTWPNRYIDSRGVVLWDAVLGIVKPDPGTLGVAPTRVPGRDDHPVQFSNSLIV